MLVGLTQSSMKLYVLRSRPPPDPVAPRHAALSRAASRAATHPKCKHYTSHPHK